MRSLRADPARTGRPPHQRGTLSKSVRAAHQQGGPFLPMRDPDAPELDEHDDGGQE
ncbi:MAG TPA: hypothetical protein VH912_16800 [Streptosporangiaceae bacterium]